MPTPVITSIRAQLLFAGSLRRAAALGTFVDALTADERLSPRRWGPAAGVSDAFDRAAVLDFAAKRSSDDFVLRLHRTGPQRIGMQIYDGLGDLGCVSIDVQGAIAGTEAELFASLDRLALSAPLEFGCVDLQFEGSDYRNSGVHVPTYYECGPPTVYPRTYFGRRLLAILGQAPGDVGAAHVLSDDLRAVDLVADPWTAGPDELVRARVPIERALRLAGILARPAGGSRTIPGPRWVQPQPRDEVR